MSKFKYTEQENEINKVLKMNQDVSTSLVNNAELKKTRKSADENIAASLELLRSLGKGDEADEAMKSARKKSIAVSSSFKPEIEPFEEIAAQANEYCPNPVSLEDIMIRKNRQVRSRKKRKFWRNGRIEEERCDHGFFWNLPE